MKTILLYVLLLSAALFMWSCHPATASDTYNAAWSPSGNSTYTSWTIDTTSGGIFAQTASGFQVTGMTLKDTLNSVFAVSVTPYKITNITTASEGSLSFTAQVLMDSVRLSDSSWVKHQFGKVSGTIMARGADSASWSTKPFAQEGANVVTFSVNPDSCSSKIKFNIILKWNTFSGGTLLNPLPRAKAVSFVFSDVTFRVNGVSVLK